MSRQDFNVSPSKETATHSRVCVCVYVVECLTRVNVLFIIFPLPVLSDVMTVNQRV